MKVSVVSYLCDVEETGRKPDNELPTPIVEILAA
jgi:hypothetical protein